MATDPSKLHDLSGNSIPGFDDKPGTDPDSANALDAAFKNVGGNPDKPDEGIAEVTEPKAKEKPAPPAKPAAPIKPTARCRKISSPSATTAS